MTEEKRPLTFNQALEIVYQIALGTRPDPKSPDKDFKVEAAKEVEALGIILQYLADQPGETEWYRIHDILSSYWARLTKYQVKALRRREGVTIVKEQPPWER